MKLIPKLSRGPLAFALSAIILVALPVRAEFPTSQNFNLRAGWNAIWIELTPSNPDINAVFAGAPIESIWTFASVVSSVDFIQNTDEPVWNRDRWLVHVPTNRLESLNNNLFKVIGNRAYLVKTTNAASLTITGEPRLRFPTWAADAFNFRGFPIDPNAPPTFANFFRPSPAHYNVAQQRLQKIYQLDNSGVWTLAGPNDLMRSGEAYWVYTAGPSDYLAPLSVSLDFGDGFQFTSASPEAVLKLKNLGTTTRTATVQDIGPATPLRYKTSTTPPSYTNLPPAYTKSLAANASSDLELAAAFAVHPEEQYESIVRVTDGQGTRYLIPLDILRTPAGTTGSAAQQEAAGRVGLWVGTITINRVSEVHAGSLSTNITTNLVTGTISREVVRAGVGTNTTPTRSEFSLRVLLHVDTNGAVNLLKDVVQMWQEATYTTDELGRQVQLTPGRYVLLTDETLIPFYKGAALRDGEMVGRRLSTADFPFPSTPANNFLPLTGLFAINNTVSGAYSIGANDPVNPFKHKYHPDHDNLDATFTSFRAEAYDFSRSFQLTFTSTNTTGVTPADYGYTSLSGNYREIVSGLHRTPIVASGPFQLRRVISTPVLNQ